jgi:hypothetical protein
MENETEQIYQKGIEASSECAVACLKAAKLLKREPNSTQIEYVIEQLFACAALSLLNLKSLASESEFLIEVANNCEEICVKTELDCTSLADFEYCKTAAIACGKCAMACKIITEM